MKLTWRNTLSEVGLTYRVQSSPDLVTWDDIGGVTNTTLTSDYSYYTTPSVTRYYFRLVKEE